MSMSEQQESNTESMHTELSEQYYKSRKQLKKWVTDSPATFLHKHLLVEAEVARIDGRQITAFDLYSRAIAAAGESGFVQVEAIANERMALFHFSFGRFLGIRCIYDVEKNAQRQRILCSGFHLFHVSIWIPLYCFEHPSIFRFTDTFR